MHGYARAVEMLLGGDCGLEVVRAKDRLANGGNSYGYRDMLLNVKLPGSEHIGELQLHFQAIIELKSAAHKTYGLLRAVGWGEDALEDEMGEEEEEGGEAAAKQGEPHAGGDNARAGDSTAAPRLGAATARVQPFLDADPRAAEAPTAHAQRTAAAGPESDQGMDAQAQLQALHAELAKRDAVIARKDADMVRKDADLARKDQELYKLRRKCC